MREDIFQELLESVREAGAISRGEIQPSRVFYYPKPDVRKLREEHGLTQ